MRQLLLCEASHICYTFACTAPSLPQPDFCAKRTSLFCPFTTLFSLSYTLFSNQNLLPVSLSLYQSFVRYQAILAPYTHYRSNKTKQASSELISSHHHRYSLCRRKSKQNNISLTQHYPSDNQPRQASPAKNHHIRDKASHSQRLKSRPASRKPLSFIKHTPSHNTSDCANPLLQRARSKDSLTTHIKHSAPPKLSRASKTTSTIMRQPLPLTLLLAASAHAATVYVTTTCTSTSTTTITRIYASSTQVITSAFPVVQTSVPLSTAPSSPSPSSASPSPSTTIVVPVSVSAPSSGSSLVYTSEVAPFPTAVGTGSAAPVGSGTGAGSASGTGAPISPVVPYKGAATRNTGSLLGGAVAIGAVALALF